MPITREQFLGMTPEQRAQVSNDDLLALRNTAQPTAQVRPVEQAQIKAPAVDLSGFSDEDLIKARSLPPEEKQKFLAGAPKSKESFDYWQAAKDVGTWVAGQFIPGGLPKMEDRPAQALKAVSQGVGALESVTGAPTRAAVGALQDDKTTIEAAGEFFSQMGKVPESAPTGKELAAKQGFSEEPMFKLPVVGEVSPAGVAGFGAEVALDPTALFGLATGKLLKAGGKAISKAVPLQEGAEQVIKAAKKLGVKPTPGQLYDSQLVKKLESALVQQRGKIGGAKLRSQIDDNIKVLKKEADNLVSRSSGKSAIEIGSEAKDQINKAVQKRLQSASDLYNRFEDAYGKAKADIQPIRDALDDLASRFAGTPELAKVKKWQKSIDKVTKKKVGKEVVKSREAQVKTIENLKEFRTSVGKLRASADPAERQIASRLYEAASKARSDSLVDAAEFSGDLAEGVAESLIRQADEIYSQTAKEVETLLTRGKKVKGGVKRAVEDFLEKTSDESIVEKLIKSADFEKTDAIRKAFPEAFETLRIGKIDNIAARAAVKGEISPNRLSKIINSMSEPTAELILGKGAKAKGRALKTFLDSVPEKLNPSGTAEMANLVKMFNILSQVGSVSQSVALSALTSGMKIQRAGQVVSGFSLPLGATQALGKTILPKDKNQGFNTPAFNQ